jgi:hypothetical protein
LGFDVKTQNAKLEERSDELNGLRGIFLMPLGEPGKNYHDDGSIFSKEDSGSFMYVIQDGRVSISRTTDQGEGP